MRSVHQQAEDQIIAAVSDAEIWLGGGLTERIFAAAPRLRWVHATSAGVDFLLFPGLVDSDVLLTNSRGVYDAGVADHVFMLMLALSRNLPRLVRQQAAGAWRKVPVAELAGRTLGIIGLGNIGREIGRRAQAFGMRVLATRGRGRADGPEQVPGIADAVYGPDGLEVVLRAADWIVLVCPLTEHTRGMIGRKQLRWIGPEAFLINVGRGALVDETALVTALQTGQIAGAGLDVFMQEPLPPTSPLWQMPNVIVTPHMGGFQASQIEQAVQLFIRNLGGYARGEQLHNLVDKRRGY